MTVLAIVFMTSAVFSVTALVTWCYFRVLGNAHRARERPRDDEQA